jgi:hypothetical protein
MSIDGLDAAIAVRSELPMCAQVDVAVDPVPAVIDLPLASQPVAPSNDRATREVDPGQLPKHTKALVSKVLESYQCEPTEEEFELLVMPDARPLAVSALAISDDGTTVAVGTASGRVLVYQCPDR